MPTPEELLLQAMLAGNQPGATLGSHLGPMMLAGDLMKRRDKEHEAQLAKQDSNLSYVTGRGSVPLGEMVPQGMDDLPPGSNVPHDEMVLRALQRGMISPDKGFEFLSGTQKHRQSLEEIGARGKQTRKNTAAEMRGEDAKSVRQLLRGIAMDNGTKYDEPMRQWAQKKLEATPRRTERGKGPGRKKVRMEEPDWAELRTIAQPGDPTVAQLAKIEGVPEEEWMHAAKGDAQAGAAFGRRFDREKAAAEKEAATTYADLGGLLDIGNIPPELAGKTIDANGTKAVMAVFDSKQGEAKLTLELQKLEAEIAQLAQAKDIAVAIHAIKSQKREALGGQSLYEVGPYLELMGLGLEAQRVGITKDLADSLIEHRPKTVAHQQAMLALHQQSQLLRSLELVVGMMPSTTTQTKEEPPSLFSEGGRSISTRTTGKDVPPGVRAQIEKLGLGHLLQPAAGPLPTVVPPHIAALRQQVSAGKSYNQLVVEMRAALGADFDEAALRRDWTQAGGR